MKIKPSRIVIFDYRIDNDDNREIIAKKFNKALDVHKYKYSAYDYFDEYKFKITNNNEYLCVLEISDAAIHEVEDTISKDIELSDGNKYKFTITFINYNKITNFGSEKYNYYLDLLKSYR